MGSFSKWVAEGMEKSGLSLRQVARESFTLQDETVMVNYMDLLKRSQTIAYAMVMGPDGTVLVHTDAPMIRKVLSDDATSAALKNRAGETPLVQNLKTTDGKDVLDVSVPIIIGIKPAEYKGVARVGFDKEAINKVVADSLVEMDRRILGAFVATLLLGLLGAVILAWLIARPIRALKDGAKKSAKANSGTGSRSIPTTNCATWPMNSI
jgi:sensor histidine kinase regulating citrate/malate metabolism